MGRSRIFRGRSSYKASDVAALFLIGLVLGAFCYLVLSLIVWLYDRFLVRS